MAEVVWAVVHVQFPASKLSLVDRIGHALRLGTAHAIDAYAFVPVASLVIDSQCPKSIAISRYAPRFFTRNAASTGGAFTIGETARA